MVFILSVEPVSSNSINRARSFGFLLAGEVQAPTVSERDVHEGITNGNCEQHGVN